MADEIKNEATEAVEETVEEATEATATDAKAKKAKGKKKWPIVVAIVAVVIVAAGAGVWVWHEQPSFCGAICHTPMDAYYESYADGSQDKWGNDITDDNAKNAMMAYAHGHNLSDGSTVDCLDCHKPVLSQQITEGMHWISGSYEVAGANAKGQTILEERDLETLAAGVGMEDEDQFCLNDSCHHVTDDGTEIKTRDDLLAATADLDPEYNPHQPQHGEYACSQCHKAHSQSVNYCTQCHSTAVVPDGWLSSSDAKQLHKLADAE